MSDEYVLFETTSHDIQKGLLEAVGYIWSGFGSWANKAEQLQGLWKFALAMGLDMSVRQDIDFLYHICNTRELMQAFNDLYSDFDDPRDTEEASISLARLVKEFD